MTGFPAAAQRLAANIAGAKMRFFSARELGAFMHATPRLKRTHPMIKSWEIQIRFQLKQVHTMSRHPRSLKQSWLVYCIIVLSAPIQSHAATTQEVSALVSRYLQAETKDQKGAVSISVAALDERQRTLEACTKMQAFLPQGQLARGRVTVGVRCVEGSNASLYVSAKVKIEGSYIKLVRPIAGGQTITTNDVQIEQGELSAHPADLVVTLQDAVGQTTRQALSPGQALRGTHLKIASSILAGQQVKVIAHGAGFSVINNGRALHSASQGDLTRVKLDNGQIVSGIAAEPGVVDVTSNR